MAFARGNGKDVVILDTAGRLHIDQPLMDELKAVNAQVKPHQNLPGRDAMVGQDAVNSAKAFNEQLELDGVILTKFDSDTRGGAALSVKAVTGKPIKFMGIGEKLEALEEFHPDRVASGCWAWATFSPLSKKPRSSSTKPRPRSSRRRWPRPLSRWTTFSSRCRSVRKMGPMKQLLGMLPGIGAAQGHADPRGGAQQDRGDHQVDEPPKERENAELMDGRRRRRIARGSGTQPEDVARLIKGFIAARDMAKKMAGLSMGNKMAMARAMGGSI